MTSFKGMKGKRGVTLIELMVVIAVLSIVMTLIYSIFISQMRASMWKGQLTEVQQNLKGAMNVLQSDFRNATSIEDTTGICNTSIAMKLGDETITYSTNGTSANPGWLKRASSDANKTAVIADNISCFDVTCFNRTGTEMPLAAFTNATAAADVRRVTATICGKTAKENPNTGEKAERSVKSSVEMRNVPQYSGSGCGVLYFDIQPRSAAFCDPPGQQPEVSIKLCDLKGKALGGDVQIYPKEPQPVQIDGTAGTTVVNVGGTAVMTVPDPGGKDCDDVTVTPGTGVVNATSPASLAPGSALEMVAVWQPVGCDYKISTSRSLMVKAGYPFQFASEASVPSPDPGSVTAFCDAGGQTQEQSEVKIKVTDSCGNVTTGEPVTVSIVDDDGAKGTLGPVTEDASGWHTAVYNAGSATGDVTIRFEDATIWNATSETFSDTITIDNTVTITPTGPADFNIVADPFASSTMDECPTNSDAMRVEVMDECGNVIAGSGELGNLSVALDMPAKGGVRVEAGAGNEYNAIYNTPSDCGDGNLDPTMTVSHSGFANTVGTTVNLTQCTLPTANLVVTRASDPPHQVASGCARTEDDKNPFVTISATLYKPDECVAWPVDTLLNFESTSVEMDPNTHNGSFEDAGPTKSVFTGAGIAQVRFFGLNNTPGTPNPPEVGKNLKIRATAKVRYDTATGSYEDSYEDSRYNDFGSNLIEVVAPGVDISFTDSSFANTVAFLPVDCALPDTLYFRVDDCDADLFAPVTAIVNSVNVLGGIRDSETVSLVGGSGFYNGSITTSIAIANTIGDGKLRVGPVDTVTVYYTDGTDGSVDTASIEASGFFDNLEGGTGGWTVAGSSTPNVSWHTEVIGGNTVFAYNDGVDFNPLVAARNYGTVVSPPFYLDVSSGTTLTFDSFAETENTDYQGNYWDSRMVFINSPAAPAWTMIEPPAIDASDSLACSTGEPALSCSVRTGLNPVAKTLLLSTQHRVGLDLSGLDPADYDGQPVRLMFRFDTWDSVANTYFGWAFDDVAVACNADIVPPASPVISGATVSANTVRLTWPLVPDAAEYTLFVYNSDRTGQPTVVVDNLAQNCVAGPGEFCYQYTQASLSGNWYFRVSASDASGNISAPSNSYLDESADTLSMTMECNDEVSSLLAPGKKKVVVKGKVTNLDGNPVGVSVDANFYAEESSTLEVDNWALITNAATGVYCGDNETDGTASPFSGGYNLVNTKIWATGAGFINSTESGFTAPGPCACP